MLKDVKTTPKCSGSPQNLKPHCEKLTKAFHDYKNATKDGDTERHDLKLSCNGEVLHCQKCWVIAAATAASGSMVRFEETTCDKPTVRDQKRKAYMIRNGFTDAAHQRMCIGENP